MLSDEIRHQVFNNFVHSQVTLEPYERDHAVVVGIYRPQEAGAASG